MPSSDVWTPRLAKVHALKVSPARSQEPLDFNRAGLQSMNGSSQPKADWDPTSPEVQRDQRAAYDEMRRRCPVAYSEFMGWSLFRHEDVTRVLLDHKTF